VSDFIDPGNFDFFARYLLAGYVIMIVRSRFVVAQRPNTGDMIVEAVILSLINQLAFQLIIWVMPQNLAVSLGKQSVLFLQVLVLPAFIGALLGLNLSRGWNNAMLRRLSMPIASPAHRAHDFAFALERPAGHVIVKYNDGTLVFGYFGERSMAASDKERSDIYLERVYSVDKDGQWSELSPPRSALLSLNGLRSIEFLDEESETE